MTVRLTSDGGAVVELRLSPLQVTRLKAIRKVSDPEPWTCTISHCVDIAIDRYLETARLVLAKGRRV